MPTREEWGDWRRAMEDREKAKDNSTSFGTVHKDQLLTDANNQSGEKPNLSSRKPQFYQNIFIPGTGNKILSIPISAAADSGKDSKPIDRWLTYGAIVVGIVLFLVKKTEPVIIGCCLFIWLLLLHPAAKFWWVEKRWWRQLLAIVALTAGVIWLGFNIPPDKASPEPTKEIALLRTDISRVKATEDDTNKAVHERQTIIIQNESSFDPLKERTLGLANSLYDFARDREILYQPLINVDGDTDDIKKQKSALREQFREESIALYNKRFKKDVHNTIMKFGVKHASIHSALVAEGVPLMGLPPFQLSTELRLLANQIDSAGHLNK